MAGFAESIVLKVPPEEAFAYLGDPSTATTVDPAVISYDPDSIPMKAGTTIRVRARLGIFPVSMTTRVREWEEGRRMVIETLRPRHPRLMRRAVRAQQARFRGIMEKRRG